MRIFSFKDGSKMSVDGGDGNDPLLISRQYTAANTVEAGRITTARHQMDIAETVKSVSWLLATASAAAALFAMVDMPFFEGTEYCFLAGTIGLGMVGIAAGAMEGIKYKKTQQLIQQQVIRAKSLDRYREAKCPFGQTDINPN